MRANERRVLEVLRSTAKKGGTGRKEIAAALGMTPGSVGTTVWHLRKKGYRIVTRNTLTLVKEPE